ncbi:MAG: ABC transporter substrate-binding protein [Pigmentiphaga sp.]|uniref:ABC transporter substrate-binding protein n=1 Tax=Pigmentiphaga sp. TaxID=1977564 RepID=UPI0029B5A5A9|nr:ABC transporter substrate-binding protein [Pigmentiphaga sp.]MDX3904691.1 ABC transporter substrate-binding protein [Pigmentiphaga sp.]
MAIHPFAYSMVAGALAALFAAAPAAGQQQKVSDDVVKIGVMTDMSSIFSDIGGKGSVIAAEMAVADFGGKVLGKPVQVVAADHQNKTDVAASRAREWFDTQQVDMVTDLLPSSVALAVAQVGKQKQRVVIVNGGGTTRLTNEDCSPYTVHYTYDTYQLTHGTVGALSAMGKDSYYFVTVDYALGASLDQDAESAIKEHKGKLVGRIKHPMNTADLSSYLLQAQASGAKVIALNNAGGDAINAIKSAKQFMIGKDGKQVLASNHLFISDVHSAGLDAAQDMVLTTSFYWDRNDETRAWSKRFFAKAGKMPTMDHAGVYSSTMHYLKAVQAAGTDAPDAVLAKMKSTPVNDFFAKNGVIRADGRMVFDVYLVRVKKPSESKGAWDYYQVLQTIPGDKAFMPLSKSACSLAKS